MEKGFTVRRIAFCALVAALYAVLTSVMWQTSSGAIQFRLSEVLCVLPAFTPAAIPGLFLGCAIANLLGGTWVDVVFGSLATLLAAICTWRIGRRHHVGETNRLSRSAKLLAPLPPVVFNALIIPFVLYYGYGLKDAFGMTETAPVLLFYALTVGVGEAVVCYLIGVPFMALLSRLPERYRKV